MVSLEDFIISEEALESINNEEVLTKQIEEGKTLQEIFGFSNDTTLEFYEVAKYILEQKRFEDAIKAFSFLTNINPYISDFWTGLGIAQQNNNDYESAVFSLSMAFTLEGGMITPYMLAVQCFMEIDDFDQAIEVLEIAETYAEENPDEEGRQQLKKDAAAAKQYVNSKRR